jgi:sortase A
MTVTAPVPTGPTGPPDRPAARTEVRNQPVDATPLGGGGSREQLRVTTSHVLLVLALLVGWLFAYLLLFSRFEEGHAQRGLYNELRAELAGGTAPMQEPIAAGAPVALLQVPTAGISDVVVVEGTTPAVLQHGPGHAAGSVLPGQAGVSVLMGRSLSYGAPFGRLADLHPGDAVTVTTGEGVFTYDVTDVRRKGDPVPAPLAAGGSRLVLVTSTGSGGGASLAPGDTLYVDATLHGKAQPAGAVTAADPMGAPMARDTSTSTLAELALALELLVAGLVGVAWLRARWTAVGAWVVGTPVVIAALWLVSSLAARLIPNLV